MGQPVFRGTWAEVDLHAIEHNIYQIKTKLPTESKVFAVVKADGYGHGAVQVAQQAIKAGADYLAVALLEEAIELRKAGIKKPILVFARVDPVHASIAAHYQITLTAFQLDWLKQVQTQSLSNDLHIHIKVDTGMGRVGMRKKNELKQFIYELKQSNCIKLTGVYTHYATADEINSDYFTEQKEQFEKWLTYFHSLWSEQVLVHSANSAASIRKPCAVFDAIRFGVSMYGLYPSKSIQELGNIQLKQAFSLHSRLIQVKKILKGQTISYGATYEAEKDEWIGTIPIGYADGWNRKLQNTHVLIQGKRKPIVGRICMDQLMIKLDQPYDVGTKVTLIGKQDDEEITVDEVAAHLDTINYEVTCMISNRVPRIYQPRE